MKKTISVIIVFLMLLPFGLVAHAGDLPTIPLTPHIPGDANADRSVDLRDVTVTSRYLAGGYNVRITGKNADVNGDGKVELKDVVLLRRYLAGGWGVTLV